MNKPMDQEPEDLEQLLDRISEADGDEDQVSISNILDAVGRRSFGPILLLAGLVTIAPIISGIPGLPVLMGALVFLTAGQLLLRCDHFWLPDLLLKRSMSRGKLSKALNLLQRPAAFVDRFLRPRLAMFVQKPATYAIALTTLPVALLTPAMEFVPYSANAAGIIFAAFGLALIAHDGVLALCGFALTLALFSVGLYFFVF